MLLIDSFRILILLLLILIGIFIWANPKRHPERKRKYYTFARAILLICITIIICFIFPMSMTTCPEPPSPRSICMYNLKQIGFGLHMYAQDYDEYFPTSFMALYPNYIGYPEIFWCPSDSDPKPTTINNNLLNWINSSQISYKYYRGYNEDAPSDLIIVEENTSNEHNYDDYAGKNVLYIDGHTSWLDKSDYQEVQRSQSINTNE